MATVGTTTVAVKTAASSKVNWIAGIGGLVTCLSALVPQIAPFIPAPYGTIALAVVTAVATIYARTFASPAVLAPSVASIH